MHVLLERASAYLAALEADRQAALALCQQKAEEAELIKARQEGFKRPWNCSAATLLPLKPHRDRTERLPLIAAMSGHPTPRSRAGAECVGR